MASTTSERKYKFFLKGCGRGAAMLMRRPCPLGSKQLSIRAFIWGIYFFLLALVLSEIDQKQEATLFLFSLSFEYDCEKSVRQLAGFFRYVEIVIMKLYAYLNWMFYIKSLYLSISKISSFFIIMSSSHEKIFVWNASIWVGGPCK